MKILQSSWESRDGIKLHLQAWEPDSKPRAMVVILHGLGEHMARYAAAAGDLVRAGFAATGMDFRGHGRSGGRRGHTPSYDALLDDLERLLLRVREKHSRLPVFLWGHSLGGALAINYVMRRQAKVAGVIATGPLLKPVVPAPPLKLALARVLDPILPTYTDRWAAVASDLSKDRTVGHAYAHDPLVHNFITARLYSGMTQAGIWALEHAAEFPLPLLLIHGTQDRLTSWEASEEFAQRLGKKCTWLPLEGWYHEVHNEPERRRVLSRMVNWMKRRLEIATKPRLSAGQMRRRMRKSRPTFGRRT